MDALTRLKQRKPWRGHIGQRALVPGRWMRATAQSPASAHDMLWLCLVMLLGMSTLLSFAHMQSAWGWAAGIAAVMVALVLMETLRGIAWISVSGVLAEQETREVALLLGKYPELMAACMHWMTPQTVLRSADFHLITRAYLDLENQAAEPVEPLRDACLTQLKPVFEQHQYPNYPALNEQARRKAKQHVKPWKTDGVPARVLKLLASGSFDCRKKLRARSVIAEWFLAAGGVHLTLIAASWLVDAWMGNYTPVSQMPRPFGVPGSILWIMLLCAPFPIATVLARKRLALTAHDLEKIKPWAVFSTKAAATYLRDIPASHAWTAYDVAYAISLSAKSEMSAILANCNLKIHLKDSKAKPPVRVDDTPLPPSPLPHRKPWRGHWGQRALLPSKPMRELGNDLTERPYFASGFVVVLVLILELVSGALLVQSAPFSLWMALAALITVLQIDLLRMVAYINGSAPIVQVGVGMRAMELATRIEGGTAVLDRWRAHPSGLRILDFRVLENCARAIAKCEPEEPRESIQQQPQNRTKVLNILAHATPYQVISGAQAKNEARDKARAAQQRKPIMLWAWCDRADESIWGFIKLWIRFYYKTPTVAKIISMATMVALYVAACGVWWMACAIMGFEVSRSWDVVFPLGTAGSIALLGVILGVTAGIAWLTNRSEAPECVMYCFIEECMGNLDVAASAAYLQTLPKDQPWAFKDLFYARTLIKRANYSNDAIRTKKQQSDEVESLMQTKQGRQGISQAQSEQLEEATPVVVEPQAPPRRRL